MFIAMNRFKIVLGKEMEFEKIWRERDTHLNGTKGFKQFHLVKVICQFFAPVAQLDRVPGYEPGGRGFESCRARYKQH